MSKTFFFCLIIREIKACARVNVSKSVNKMKVEFSNFTVVIPFYPIFFGVLENLDVVEAYMHAKTR